MDADLILQNFEGFDWDDGNFTKNSQKHNVTSNECEQIFFNQPIIVSEDVKHSQNEPRYYVLGQTDLGRMLFLVFTPRGNLIRVISARDMNKCERGVYAKA